MAMENIITTKLTGWKSVLAVLGVVAFAVMCVVLAMPNTEKPRFSYTINEPWMSAQLISPGEILIQKDPKTVEQEREEALRNEYLPYYNCDMSVAQEQTDRLLKTYGEGTADVSAYGVQVVADVLKQVYSQGILSQADYSRMMGTDTTASIICVTDKQAEHRYVRDLYSVKGAYEALFKDPRLDGMQATLQQMNLNEYLQPNVKYDEERSNQAKQDILATIPTNSGMMKMGQEIINRGEIVTEEKARMIDSYNEFIMSNYKDNGYQIYFTNIIQACYVSMLLFCLVGYTLLFRRDYMQKPRSLAMVLFLLIVFPVINALLMRFDPRNVYVLPICLAPMFVRVFLDSRTAFMVHVTLTLICTAVVSDKFEYILVQSVAGFVAICALRELSKRSQIFFTAFLVFISYMVSYTVVKYLDNKDIAFDAMRHSYYCFVGNGVLLLLTYPLMFAVEKAFGFISPVTLFELSDTNRNLLRRLSEVAPGTFQHSIMVSNLASAIATEIGAKSLLVRVGALYHDIGKMVNPVFFTENQAGVNPHSRLTPQESAQIIISHVTEGVKMAEKFGVPDVIRNFILTHHGRGMARYFYNTYKNEHPDEEVDEKPFRYPGPNPFSQEQAILMMADTVEAAARSLKEYTEESISALVNRIIDGQVKEGYFANCPITFRDIAVAKRVLIDRLKSIYHTRVQYPELKTKDEAQ